MRKSDLQAPALAIFRVNELIQGRYVLDLQVFAIPFQPLAWGAQGEHAQQDDFGEWSRILKIGNRLQPPLQASSHSS